MNVIKFRFRLSKNNWSYFEKKSIKKIICILANSSTNAFIWENKLTFRIVTRLMFIAALIIRYLLFFFFIKNQKLRYKSWHFSKNSAFILSRSIFMTVLWKALKIEKSTICQISWKTIRIFMSEIISDFIWSISEKFQAKTVFRLYRQNNKNFFSFICMLSFTSIFFIRFEIIREFWKIVENFDINQWSYFIRNRWNFRFFFSTIIEIFQSSFSKDLFSFENFQFTDRILSVFFLYKMKTFVFSLLSFMSNKSKRLKNRIALKRLKRLKEKIDISLSIVVEKSNTLFEIVLKIDIFSNESFSFSLKIFVEIKWNSLFCWTYDMKRSFEI